MESGEYFLNEGQRLARKKAEKMKRAKETAAARKAARAQVYVHIYTYVYIHRRSRHIALVAGGGDR